MKILVINPGGTSTKIAVYDNNLMTKKTITHVRSDLEIYNSVVDQLGFRKKSIMDFLDQNKIDIRSIDAIAGRGGLMKPITGGTYLINDLMVKDLKDAINGEHASNLGALIAKEIGDELNVPSFVVDPVSVDEFREISRISGLKELPRSSWLHSLNHKAVSRKIAEKLNLSYIDCNFIVAHLGSGNSVVAHMKGKMVDGSGGRTDGPFSPERSGGLPTYPLVKLCFSGKYSENELIDKISNIGGFYEYLGTKDMIEVESRIENGDEKAKLIFDSFVYQVAKEISMYGATFCGKVDRIIITGGVAHSKKVIQAIEKYVSYLAPIEVVPGEMEMEALALGVVRVLGDTEKAKVYT